MRPYLLLAIPLVVLGYMAFSKPSRSAEDQADADTIGEACNHLAFAPNLIDRQSEPVQNMLKACEVKLLWR